MLTTRPRGKRNGHAILTAEDVIQIRQRVSSGEMNKTVAADLRSFIQPRLHNRQTKNMEACMRLFRPYVPLSVRVQVAERQVEEIVKLDDVYGSTFQNWTLQHRLDVLHERLAKSFGCELKDLRLDHDPPLAARPKERRGLGKKTYYIPDANDSYHLFYRPHGPQFEGSHLIKTNVRGDHGQHPDRVLIKKARRLERGPKPKRGQKIHSRGFDKKSRPFPKRKKP